MAIKKLNSEDVRKWQERLKISREWRRPHQEKWERFIGYLKNEFYDYQPDDDEVAVNLVHPHIRVIIPAIYSKNPDVLVRGSREELREAAHTLQELIRYYLRELDVKSEVKLSILDALVCGHGWIKTGYQTEFELGEEENPLISQFLKRLGIQPGEGDPESNYAIQPNEKIVAESPWVKRVSPFNVLVAPFSERSDELAWIAESSLVPTRDIKKNPIYENTKGLSHNHNAIQLIRGYKKYNNPSFDAKIEGDDYLEYTVLHEIWDAREGTVFTLAEDHPKALAQPKENIYTTFLNSRFPYEMLRFNEVTDEFYPESDIAPWEAQQLELNKTRTQMIRHRKRYNRKYAAHSMLTEENMRDLQTGEDGIILKVESSDVGVDKVVFPIQDAPLPPEVYAIEARIKEDIISIGGIQDYLGTSGGANTATEAAIENQKSQNRVAERLDVVGNFAGRVARNIAMISQKFMSAEQVAEILGSNLAGNWVQIEDDDTIKREFFFEIVFGSTSPIGVALDRQQFMAAYNILRDDPLINQLRLRIELLRKLGYSEAEAWLDPRAAAMLKHLQMQQMASGILGPDGRPVSSSGGSQSGLGPGVPSIGSLISGQNRTGQPHIRQPGSVGGQALVR
jgi:hypothetical protein